MAFDPNKYEKTAPFSSRTCIKCGNPRSAAYYIRIKSDFFPDGYSHICNLCIKDYIKKHNKEWKYIDKLCQYFNIPFVPKEWEKVNAEYGEDAFISYSQIFLNSDFDGLDWSTYNEEFLKLQAAGKLEEELPLISDERRDKLISKWGSNYDDEALTYLENLYDGLLMTQNISGALQADQAIKICKISYELDCRIREGSDFDKMLTAYDKLVKTAEFTPKNVKNASDFESVGELCKWLEKGGWKNKFYDNITRDIVDETQKNIQAYNQRLYINESGIGDEITRRIEALKTAVESENYYDTHQEYDLDEFENIGYEELMKNNDFQADLEVE